MKSERIFNKKNWKSLGFNEFSSVFGIKIRNTLSFSHEKSEKLIKLSFSIKI